MFPSERNIGFSLQSAFSFSSGMFVFYSKKSQLSLENIYYNEYVIINQQLRTSVTVSNT